MNVTAPKRTAHTWRFPSRIRPNTFSWRSSPTAAARIKDAVAEIKSVARTDLPSAAQGAIRLIERLCPTLEPVDSSSGALGSAVGHAIETLVPIISAADVPVPVRQQWLQRLYEAHAADQMPYIEILADHWGTLCVTAQLASAWAEQMIDRTRRALCGDRSHREHYHGTSACLSALLRATRYADLHALLADTNFPPYKQYAALADAAEGKTDEAIAIAESLRPTRRPDPAVELLCEWILLQAGRVEEAYRRFGLSAHVGGTYLGTFRAVAKTYPSVPREQILRDLIRQSPGG